MDRLPYELATAVVAHAEPSIGAAVALAGHIAHDQVAVAWAHSLLASGDATYGPPQFIQRTKLTLSSGALPPTTPYMQGLAESLCDGGGQGDRGCPLRHVFQSPPVLDYLLLPSKDRLAAAGEMLDHLVREGRTWSAPGPTSAPYYLHYGDYSAASYYPPAPPPPPTALMGTYSAYGAAFGYGTPPKSVVAHPPTPEAHRLRVVPEALQLPALFLYAGDMIHFQRAVQSLISGIPSLATATASIRHWLPLCMDDDRLIRGPFPGWASDEFIDDGLDKPVTLPMVWALLAAVEGRAAALDFVVLEIKVVASVDALISWFSMLAPSQSIMYGFNALPTADRALPVWRWLVDRGYVMAILPRLDLFKYLQSMFGHESEVREGHGLPIGDLMPAISGSYIRAVQYGMFINPGDAIRITSAAFPDRLQAVLVSTARDPSTLSAILEFSDEAAGATIDWDELMAALFEARFAAVADDDDDDNNNIRDPFEWDPKDSALLLSLATSAVASHARSSASRQAAAAAAARALDQLSPKSRLATFVYAATSTISLPHDLNTAGQFPDLPSDWPAWQCILDRVLPPSADVDPKTIAAFVAGSLARRVIQRGTDPLRVRLSQLGKFGADTPWTAMDTLPLSQITTLAIPSAASAKLAPVWATAKLAVLAPTAMARAIEYTAAVAPWLWQLRLDVVVLQGSAAETALPPVRWWAGIAATMMRDEMPEAARVVVQNAVADALPDFEQELRVLECQFPGVIGFAREAGFAFSSS
ncbi:hypothetical protein BC828DRAFT_406836 [Blastocladiella britannica]|nr:hypothetical protein BC828DRAFT_406836 [Blastocladiella britannica]